MPTQAERTEATRGALVGAAGRLWGERGYAAVGTEEVVAAAGVTRGALYHHFRDKRDLFRAVFVAEEQAMVQRVAERLSAVDGAYAQLAAALEATIDLVADPRVARISYLEAPAVLGFEEWRAIVQEQSLGLIVAMLERAMGEGELRTAPAAPLAHLVLGALQEGGRVIAAGGDRTQVATALRSLLDGLRA
jgi:AcrR family transcriptional regulator